MPNFTHLLGSQSTYLHWHTFIHTLTISQNTMVSLVWPGPPNKHLKPSALPKGLLKDIKITAWTKKGFNSISWHMHPFKGLMLWPKSQDAHILWLHTARPSDALCCFTCWTTGVKVKLWFNRNTTSLRWSGLCHLNTENKLGSKNMQFEDLRQ